MVYWRHNQCDCRKRDVRLDVINHNLDVVINHSRYLDDVRG